MGPNNDKSRCITLFGMQAFHVFTRNGLNYMGGIIQSLNSLIDRNDIRAHLG